MKVEVSQKVEQVIFIEVELPYYYKHDLMSDFGDSIIYGKIEERKHTSIHERHENGITFELEIEEHSSIKNAGLSSYFEDEYKSSKEEFESAKIRAKEFLKKF